MKCSYIYTQWDSPVEPAKRGDLCGDLAEFLVGGDRLCEEHATDAMRLRSGFKPDLVADEPPVVA